MLRKFIYSEKADNIYFEIIKNSKSNIAIIFLHGLGGSRRSWGKLYNNLSKDASLYFIDLLGYGFSAKPNIIYSLENHIAALKKFIDREVREKNIIFVGHSLGSIIALGYNSKYPEEVKKAILIALPYYHSPEEAKQYVSKESRYTFIFTYNLRTKILCTIMCSVFGSITRQISPFFMRDLPRGIAQDIHRHSYQSYISTLTNVLYQQNLNTLLNDSMKKKVLLIHGTKDKIVPIENIHELVKTYRLPLTIHPDGDHRFPLFESNPIIKAIEKELL